MLLIAIRTIDSTWDRISVSAPPSPLPREDARTEDQSAASPEEQSGPVNPISEIDEGEYYPSLRSTWSLTSNRSGRSASPDYLVCLSAATSDMFDSRIAIGLCLPAFRWASTGGRCNPAFYLGAYIQPLVRVAQYTAVCMLSQVFRSLTMHLLTETSKLVNGIRRSFDYQWVLRDRS